MSPHRQRYEQLLVDAATHDLTPEDRQELDSILRQNPEWRDDSFEIAAAALHVAMQSHLERMPEALRQRLRGA